MYQSSAEQVVRARPIEADSKQQKPVSREAASPAFQIIFGLGTIQVVTMAFNLLRSKVAAVTLGPTGIGAMSLVDQVTSLVAQVSSFSLPLAAVKFLSETHSEDRDAFARLYAAFLRVLLMMSLGGAGIAILALLWRPEILGRELGAYASIAIIALLAFPASNLTVFLTNALASCQRIRASALYGLLSAALLAIACSAGILIAGLSGYYFAQLLVMTASALGAMFYLRKREQLSVIRKGIRLITEFRRYPKVVGFSAALYITSFTSPFSELIARYTVLNSGGLEITGIFQAAMGLGLILRTVLRSSFSLFLTPYLNRKIEISEKLRQAGDFLRMLSVAIVIMALPLALVPDLWLSALYSQKFSSASGTVYAFLVAIGLQLIAAVNVAMLIGLGDISGYVWASILGDLATAVFSYLWVPRYGIWGVALALIVNASLVFGISAWRLGHRHRIPICTVIGWFPFVMVAIVGVAGAISSSWLHVNTLSSLGFKATLWIVLSTSLLMVVRQHCIIPRNIFR